MGTDVSQEIFGLDTQELWTCQTEHLLEILLNFMRRNMKMGLMQNFDFIQKNAKDCM